MKKLILIGIIIGLAYTSHAQNLSHAGWTALLKMHVDTKGIVNYKGLKSDSDKLQSYLNLLSENSPKDSWSKDEKVAYWINVYNAFTVKLIVDHYPVKSIKNIKGGAPWDYKFIKIGDKKLSLNEVEHGILRKKYPDPRVHFAVNCASFSCPILLNRAFEASNLDTDMDMLTKNFINDKNRNIITPDKVEISQLFNWYKSDFVKNGTLIDFIDKYSLVDVKSKAKVKFMNYDWSLNE